ncbi:hypothetical protein HNQ94_001036 [Salirhabdus euzebyi]|uniref:BshB3 potential contributor to bacillithiol synthesis n=1 Tax=Salirhabdus euzebyi TaxID=394506 RepID=A0A841PZ75_9BACI|nr:BshB3 potential contributor to bacillithiol synthesis [Salirhabdus euzebyi]MBB6452591.1 hypothetical protein [Salirhabdus euzebyi]
MKYIVFIAIFICTIALILTLVAANATNKDYSSKKSFSSLSIIYLLLVPVIFIGCIVALFLF